MKIPFEFFHRLSTPSVLFFSHGCWLAIDLGIVNHLLWMMVGE